MLGNVIHLNPTLPVGVMSITDLQNFRFNHPKIFTNAFLISVFSEIYAYSHNPHTYIIFMQAENFQKVSCFSFFTKKNLNTNFKLYIQILANLHEDFEQKGFPLPRSRTYSKLVHLHIKTVW